MPDCDLGFLSEKKTSNSYRPEIQVTLLLLCTFLLVVSLVSTSDALKKIVGAAPSDTNDIMEKGQETRLTRSPVGLRSTFKSERRSY